MAELIWGDDDFTKLFTAEYGYVNPDLASIYGVSAPAAEFGESPASPTIPNEQASLGQA